jgi:hypothetical protein
MPTPVLHLYKDETGCVWLSVRSPNGKKASIRIDRLLEEYGPNVNKAFEDYFFFTKPERCPKCRIYHIFDPCPHKE